MFSFSKFVVFVALFTQTQGKESAKNDSGRRDINKVLEILTNVPEGDRKNYHGRMLSFGHEWARGAVVFAKEFEINKTRYFERYEKFVRYFSLIFQLKDNGADVLTNFVADETMIAGLLKSISDEYNLTDDLKKAKVSQIKVEMSADIQRNEIDNFYTKWSKLYDRAVEANNILVDSTTECLLGRCEESALKTLSDGKKTLEEMDKVEAPDSIKSKSEKQLYQIEGRIKVLEKFAKDIQAGTKLSKLQADLKKQKDKNFTLALGLGLGLGLGLPFVFAVVLFVLFKSGRLSWVTPLESKA